MKRCPACDDEESEFYIIIRYKDNSADLCDRCKFVHDVVQAAIVRGIILISGTWQEVRVKRPRERVDEIPRNVSEGAETPNWTTWSEFEWWDLCDFGGFTRDNFELFVLPDSPKPFPDLPEKHLPHDTSSLAAVANVQAWMKLCQETHKTCSPQQPELTLLPYRVIDVGADEVRLIETDKEEGQYVCLSHCWGKVLPSCRTMSATLASNKRRIDWDTLPKTFQDAINFTRRLGLKYIWIDSICIIQDDLTDWAQQSASMATIYANAVVTLCATASFHDKGGCHPSPPPQYEPHKLQILGKDLIECVVYMRRHLDQSHVPEWGETSLWPNAKNFPLLTRAWIFQERLLSRRLVHFVAGEIIWECAELSACECFQDEMGTNSPYMPSYSTKTYHRQALCASDRKVIEEYWSDIITDYSGLNLTFEKDKLPALSGVAQQMLDHRPGDKYVAGLWKNTIISDLAWCAHIIGQEKTRRPSTYRAPSWSWASLDTPCDAGDSFKKRFGIYDYAKRLNLHDYAQCVEVSVTLAGPNPTGEVSAGHIVLSAPLKIAKLREDGNAKGWWDKWFIEADDLTGRFSADCYSDFENGALAAGDDVMCVRLVKGNDLNDMCLVLKQRNLDGETVYQRVGCFHPKTEELEKLWFGPDTQQGEVKIV